MTSNATFKGADGRANAGATPRDPATGDVGATGATDATLRAIAPDVWHAPGAPLRLPGGVYLPLASTVMRLSDRSLLVYSPIAFSDEQARAIDALGDVRYLVGPNLLHHLHLRAAIERWLRAALLGAPGLATKRANLKFDHELASGAPLDAALEIEVIGGAPKINETVLLHRPSGTLVCADFLFHVTKPANLRTRLVLAMTGTGGRDLRQSRVWKLAVRQRAETRASIDRLLRWPIAAIAPAHGTPLTASAATLAPKLARAYGGPVATALPAVASASVA